VPVTAHAIDLIGVEDGTVAIRLTCSAGFYVRSLAHDLGGKLGTGAHLQALRRTRSGDATLDDALPLEIVERDPELARRGTIRLSDMLPGLSAVRLTGDGVRRAVHGQDIGPADTEAAGSLVGAADRAKAAVTFVRLVDSAGQLVAIASPRGGSGLLHPAVVLM
jgi:tRNA pseudouridine55 synthase